MADPMSDERLAEIREEIDLGTGVLSEKTALELLAEVEHLNAAVRGGLSHVGNALAERDAAREQLAAFVPPGVLSAGETPALCGTCRELLCVPGLPGCAWCVRAEMGRLAAARDEARADAQRYLGKLVSQGRIIGDLQAQIATLRDQLGSEQVKRHRAERERDQAQRAAAVLRASRDEVREKLRQAETALRESREG